ncbi:hypothetical protein [Methylobacterium sp. J-076]|uniref:hypothetical protein n=1 Tax=Methylobacterium sp. J-076 TaxID=2836655 RepID=UPI001FB8BDA9|nr:hypothetical protein [Methylobacterium sp. J-076]MCJ2015336.1 hypothetical protein [Methylobacterium sp. J-076]
MLGTLSRISLVTVALVGLAGAASARDATAPKKKGQMTSLNGFKPAYRADTRVSGSDQPYAWPVSDRYRPVSHPYFGRAF